MEDHRAEESPGLQAGSLVGQPVEETGGGTRKDWRRREESNKDSNPLDECLQLHSNATKVVGPS